MTIRIVIDVSSTADGRVAVGANTEPFKMLGTPDAVGEMWVGICMAINEYVRSQGIVGFDCLSASPIPPNPS